MRIQMHHANLARRHIANHDHAAVCGSGDGARDVLAVATGHVERYRFLEALIDAARMKILGSCSHLADQESRQHCGGNGERAFRQQLHCELGSPGRN